MKEGGKIHIFAPSGKYSAYFPPNLLKTIGRLKERNLQ